MLEHIPYMCTEITLMFVSYIVSCKYVSYIEKSMTIYLSFLCESMYISDEYKMYCCCSVLLQDASICQVSESTRVQNPTSSQIILRVLIVYLTVLETSSFRKKNGRVHFISFSVAKFLCPNYRFGANRDIQHDVQHDVFAK